MIKHVVTEQNYGGMKFMSYTMKIWKRAVKARSPTDAMSVWRVLMEKVRRSWPVDVEKAYKGGTMVLYDRSGREVCEGDAEHGSNLF